MCSGSESGAKVAVINGIPLSEVDNFLERKPNGGHVPLVGGLNIVVQIYPG